MSAPTDSFILHPQLAADTYLVGDLALSRVLLMDDTRFPWLILVPRRADMRDWIDLIPADRHHLLDEVDLCSLALRARHRPDKLNLGALGNLVAQLHVHVIARFAHDAAWPRPVWGIGTRVPYSAQAAASHIADLRSRLGLVG